MQPLKLLSLVIAMALCGCQRDASPPVASAVAAIPLAAGVAHADTAAPAAPDLIARGDYLVRTTGCNDCHTPGYAEQQGNVDRSSWLVGSPLGYKGPWGTTYAVNLRLKLADMDEAQWLDYSSRLKTRPIMPDFAVRAMTVEDRRAIYRFIKSLGPGGQPAPAYVPPGQTPSPPYFELVLPTPPASEPIARG